MRKIILERELGDAASENSSEPENDAEVILLNPHYACPWGRKKVLGKRVEEGEGSGPRRELFDLAAAQLCQRWNPTPSTR